MKRTATRAGSEGSCVVVYIVIMQFKQEGAKGFCRVKAACWCVSSPALWWQWFVSACFVEAQL